MSRNKKKDLAHIILFIILDAIIIYGLFSKSFRHYLNGQGQFGNDIGEILIVFSFFILPIFIIYRILYFFDVNSLKVQCIVILLGIISFFFYFNIGKWIRDKELSTGSVIIPAVVDSYSELRYKGTIYKSFNIRYINLEKKSVTSFRYPERERVVIGDTILIKHAIEGASFEVYEYMPTPKEIKEAQFNLEQWQKKKTLSKKTICQEEDTKGRI